MLVHLTARTTIGSPLAEWDVAARLWRSLQRAFPRALAVVLMPNHPHVIADVDDPARARLALALVLGALSRRGSGTGRVAAAARWEPVPPPGSITDVAHLRRQLRYVALNPCRARLVRDPLEWEWSTHRDVLGAVAEPWVTGPSLAEAVNAKRTRPDRFAAEWHAYVSADPSCAVAGTPAPRPAPPTELPVEPLARVVAAAAAATRSFGAAVRERTLTRRLFVQLAWRHGWRHTPTLARACGVTVQAVGQLLARPGATLQAAGDLCLGDARLLVTRGPAPTPQNLNVMPARP